MSLQEAYLKVKSNFDEEKAEKVHQDTQRLKELMEELRQQKGPSEVLTPEEIRGLWKQIGY